MTNHLGTIAAAIEKINTGDVPGYVRTIYHPDASFHGFPDMYPATRDGIQSFFEALVAAVPDLKVEPLDIVDAGNKVAARIRITGTHQGELFGSPGTGTTVDVQAITILRFEGDLCVERWNRLDDVSFLTQIGVLGRAAA